MGNRLYIGNLPFSATAEDVRGAFAPHGAVTDVRLVMDRATGRSRGFAFVTMGTDEEAERAMKKMDGAMLAGRPLRVNEAQDRVSRPGGFGGGGGGFGARPSFGANPGFGGNGGYGGGFPGPDAFAAGPGAGGGFDRGFGDNRKRRGTGGRDFRSGPKERRRGERW
jgi:RNA recognition motif-containing protein